MCLRQPDGMVVGEVFGGADPGVARDQVADPVAGRRRDRVPEVARRTRWSPDCRALAGTAAGRVLLTVRGRRLGADRAHASGSCRRPGSRSGWRPSCARPSTSTATSATPSARPAGRPPGVPGAVRPQGGEPPRPGRGGDRWPAGRGWLRSLPGPALEELKQLQGIGDFSAELVLLRGAGDPDHLPEHEPRLPRGRPRLRPRRAPDRWLRERAQAGPYRTWVVLLLRVLLETETGEIRGTGTAGSAAAPGPSRADLAEARAGQAQATRPSSEAVARPTWRGTTRTV